MAAVVAEHCGADGYSSMLLYDGCGGWAIADASGNRPASLYQVLVWLGEYLDCAEVYDLSAVCDALLLVARALRRMTYQVCEPTY